MTLPWGKNVFIIAEAGVNHNGDPKLAMDLIAVAKDANADAVKFQTWKPGELTGKYAIKTSYMKGLTPEDESRAEISSRLCLSYDVFRNLQNYAIEKGILFLSTPDGFESLDYLSEELKIPYIKVGSSELNHVQFLKAVGKKKKPVILSTGLGTMKEVADAVEILSKGDPNLQLVILQCTSQYPVPLEDINLRSIVTMRDHFQVPTGFSDHSIGMEAGIAATALGACIIEKHFTLDKNMDGPDHQTSLEPEELKAYVNAIKKTSLLLGDGKKRRMPSEAPNLSSIRRSVVATENLQAGVIIKLGMLTCKRPATGFEPLFLETLVGKKLLVDVQTDQPIDQKMIA